MPKYNKRTDPRNFADDLSRQIKFEKGRLVELMFELENAMKNEHAGTGPGSMEIADLMYGIELQKKVIAILRRRLSVL